MSDFHAALTVGADEDLLPLSALLHQRGVVHRVYEQGGTQVLAVADAARVPEVESLYRAWRGGELQITLERKPAARRSPAGGGIAGIARRAPVTLVLILASVVGFLLVYLPFTFQFAAWFTILPFRLEGDQLFIGTMQGEYWRLITPVFLHFGWLHITFNCLWMWDLGPRVEQVIGRFNMVMLFLTIALVSNMSQFLFADPGLFGGMSGVVYGLLGFAWVGPLLQPAWRIQPTPAIMFFMVGWLIACMVGVVEVLGFGKIANAAHLGGLVCGAALGAVFGLLSRLGGDKQSGPRL